MPHTHLRLTAAFLFAALACSIVATAGRTQTSAPPRLTNTPAHATSLNPTLSGDGRRVAFESSADLTGAGGAQGFRAFLAETAGEAAFVRLAVSRAQVAAISQDGSRVAFTSAEDLTGANPDRNPEIFLRDGEALTQLTATTPDDATTRARDGSFQPSLSDDGRLVAFSSNRDLTGANPDGNFEIFVHDTAARTFTQITNSVAVAGASDAKMSGDGSHVAYVRDGTALGSAEEARRDLILFDRQRNAGRVVAGDVPGLALTPGRAVSDDGLRVVYAAANAGGASQVFLYDGRNDVVRQLTTLGTRASDVPLHPTISGDGSRAAFATRRGVFTGEPVGGVDLYVFDLPTAKLARVTDAPARATAEVVSSLDDAGSLVAFNFPRVLADPAVEDEFANTSEIFVARLDARPPFASDLTILHAASLSHAPDKSLAPGQIAIARGKNLALAAARALPAPDKSFPRAFKGVGVAVNGRPAPIFFVSPTQINFQIPAETETGTALVAVRNHDGYEARAEVHVARAAPGVFTESGDGRGAAVALDALNLLRGPFDPSDAAGEPRRLSIFTTGLGQARGVSVTAAGLGLAVEAVVPSPDLPGLEEVHVLLQRRLAGAGVVPLVITADGHTSNATTLHFVGARRPARLVLSPDVAALGVGRSLRFSAAAFDADGFLIDGAPVGFDSSDESVATVDASGAARGVGVGVATIRASAGEVSATAELRVRPLSLVLNEALADPPDGAAGDANRDGSRSASQDEFVEIVNASEVDIDLGGHSLAARAPGGGRTTRHVFTTGTILAPGTAAVVFGGAAQSTFNPDDAAFGGAHVSTASTGGLSLLNSGATISLLDPSGAPVEELTYGETGGPDGDRDQSLARAPDVTGSFSLHLSAAPDPARAFSPGTKVDGTPFLPTAPIARIEISPASASVQVGSSQMFIARAFGADGRDLQGVLFRWQTGDASVATVDERGLALGVKAGAAEIFARARGVESPRATLTVTPPPRRVVRVEVSPPAAIVNRGGAQKFSARAFDQNDKAVADVVFAWSSSDPAVASVDADGLARGVGVGPVKIVASTPDGAGGTVEAEAALEVRVPLVLNELLADVPPDDTATAAAEGDSNRDGVRAAGDDEFVELLNASDAPVNLSGLRLSDATGTRFTFPANTQLEAGRSVLVFGGGSPPADDPAFGGALVFAASALSLNDGGDTLALKLTVGSTEFVVFTQTYGTAGGPPAPSDQSLTRAPDASAASATGEFTPHLSAPGSQARNFSPGTRADGTPFGSPPVARIEIAPAAARLDIGGTQTFTARAFTGPAGAEVEITNTSFHWDVSDAGRASLAPATGRATSATALAAAQLTVRARAGGQQATATLAINPPPPVLTRVELTPRTAGLSVGESRQFTARAFDQYDAPLRVNSITFTSRAPAVASVDSQSLAPDGTEATATVTARGEGASQITATAGDGTRTVESAPAAVTVEPPPAVPTAGQLIINEALVAFSASATQPRADFVELYNPTDRTLDISGLVVSFRAGGSSNNIRAVTLPGAVGSDTLRIRPRSYFLIINGAQTFGAVIHTVDGRPDGYDAGKEAVDINPATGAAVASTCAVSSSCFDLNNTSGAIKIEIGGARLDGLAYKGGADPAAPFLAFGEGALFSFASGTTNDLVRTPNAADTNDNAADFRRNGSTGSVTPKGTNP